MKRRINPLKLLVLLAVVATQVDAGTPFNCETVQSGAWNNPSTWTGCDGGFPDNTDKHATIKAGHLIFLDIETITINGLMMENGGQLNITDSTDEKQIWVTSSAFSTANGEIHLQADLVINNNDHDVVLGSVNGRNNLTINSSQNTVFTGDLGAGGGGNSLRSITTDALGQSVFDQSLTIGTFVDIDHLTNHTSFNDLVLIGDDVQLFIDHSAFNKNLEFNGGINSAGGGAHELSIDVGSHSEVIFNGDVRVGSLHVFGLGAQVINGAVETLADAHNTGDILLSVEVILAGDSSLTTLSSGNITFQAKISDDGLVATSSLLEINSSNLITVYDFSDSEPIDGVEFSNSGEVNLVHTVTTVGAQIYQGTVNLFIGSDFTSLTDKAYFNAGLVGNNSTATTKLNFFSDYAFHPEQFTDMQSIEFGPMGKTTLEKDITAFENLRFYNPVELFNSITISATNIQFESDLALGAHSLELNTVNSNNNWWQNRVQGSITGASGQFIKTGDGSFTINSASGDVDLIQASEGILAINGNHQSHVVANNDANIFGDFTSTRALTLEDDSEVSPGDAVGAIGLNELIMTASSTISMDLAGALNNNLYDHFIVQNLVQLGGQLSINTNYDIELGDEFTIIENHGTDPVNGTLNGVPEGGTINNNFTITYQGGDGNDVVLTSNCVAETSVTNGNDSGPGSLRMAIANTCKDGNVNLVGPLDISLESAIVVDNPFLLINGSGQTITATAGNSVFEVLLDSWVLFSDLTIKNTVSPSGALINHGQVNLESMYFENNMNSGANGGGAITNFGVLIIKNSSFYQNNASQGGALHNDGGTVHVATSTFYQNGNLFTLQGGAIYNNDNFFTLRGVTIHESGDGSVVAGNSIYNTGDGLNFRIQNSSISSSHSVISECMGTPSDPPDFRHNFVSDGSCEAQYSGDPGLGTWGDHGGATPTVPILNGSILINTAHHAVCFLDNDAQNGVPRSIGLTCDIGAFEYLDESPPEVASVRVQAAALGMCGNTPLLSDQIQVTFNEPMVEADDVTHYDVIHAGADQSFLTADDLSFQVVAADSDLSRLTPTVTLTTDVPIPNGLVRLLVDGDLRNEFFLPLYDGDGYQHPYRVDLDNQFQGGHFDDCVDVDALAPWSIQANNPTTGADQDNSNASNSLAAVVAQNQPMQLAQCVGLTGGLVIDLNASMRRVASTAQLENFDSGNDSFDITGQCRQFDDVDCFGNELDAMTTSLENQVGSASWQSINMNLGLSNPATQSVLCGFEVMPNQSTLAHFFVDGVTLKATTDLIFENGFND